jgi:hypothetical protein
LEVRIGLLDVEVLLDKKNISANINNTMNNNLNYTAGVMIKSLRFLIIFLIFQPFSLAQIQSNLEKFYSLVDSASILILKDIGNAKEVNLELNLGNDYTIFANQIRGKLLSNGVKLISDNPPAPNSLTVNFVIDNCFVEYSDSFRDGFFGDFYIERNLKLSGNYLISSKLDLTKFELTSIDTINAENYLEIENRSFPFTRGKPPEEPFFSSLLEPILAVGAAAVAVILFFSVRSK